MKTRFKHLLFAAVPYWIVQLILLLTRYIDSKVVVQMYLPIFVVAAFLLLFGQYVAGHGLWFFAAAGLMTEWIMGITDAGGRTNTIGIVANMALLMGGVAVSVLIQLLLNARKKKKKEQEIQEIQE